MAFTPASYNGHDLVNLACIILIAATEEVDIIDELVIVDEACRFRGVRLVMGLSSSRTQLTDTDISQQAL